MAVFGESVIEDLRLGQSEDGFNSSLTRTHLLSGFQLWNWSSDSKPIIVTVNLLFVMLNTHTIR